MVCLSTVKQAAYIESKRQLRFWEDKIKINESEGSFTFKGQYYSRHTHSIHSSLKPYITRATKRTVIIPFTIRFFVLLS